MNHEPESVRTKLWQLGMLKWKLWDQQRHLYETIRGLPSNTSTAVVLCSRQYGKSYLGSLLAVEDCIRFPGCSVLVVGPTIKQTVDIVHQSIRKIAEDAPPGLIKRSKSETRWYIGDSELIVGGFDVSNATRQRGKTIQNIYLEEIVDSNPDQYNETIRSDLGPALTHSKGGKMVFLTTPPRLPDHPFLLDTVPEAQFHNSYFCYTIDDNKQLSEEQYDACVRRCGGKDTIEFQREYLCKVVRDTTITVVPHFNADFHVREFNLPNSAHVQVAVDMGGVRDFTVGLIHTYDFASDTDLVWDEVMFPVNTPTSVIIEGLQKLEKGHQIHQRWFDAPPQLVSIDLAQIGYYASVPIKTDWMAAVNNMSSRFSQGKVLVHPRCKFLIQSLRSGIFNKTKTDFERTLTLGHCDALAALMYGIRHQDRSAPYSTFQVPGGIRLGQEQFDIKIPHPTKRVGSFR